MGKQGKELITEINLQVISKQTASGFMNKHRKSIAKIGFGTWRGRLGN